MESLIPPFFISRIDEPHQQNAMKTQIFKRIHLLQRHISWTVGLLVVLVSSLPAYAETIVVDYIQVIVNNEILTHQEVEETRAVFRQQILQRIPEGPARERELENLEKNLAQNIVRDLLLINRAKELNIAVTDADVEKRMDRLAETNPQVLQFMNENELREGIVRDIQKQRVLSQEVDSNVRIEETRVLALCRQQLDREKQVGIAQILFRTQDESVAETKAIQVTALWDQGSSFEELARLYSEDPSVKQTGGKLGLFRKGQLLPAIDEVAFVMKEGTLSNLVKSEFGYHLLHVYEILYPSGVDCDNLTPQQRQPLYNVVFQQERQNVLQSYFQKLRSSARVVCVQFKAVGPTCE